MKKFNICLIIIILVFSSKLDAKEKMRLAIMDLEPKSVSKDIAGTVSDLLRTELFNTGLFRVIERGEMNTILKEQGFQMSGCTETECAVQMGKLLSARKILVGTISKLGIKYIINARIVDVERGEMEFGENASADTEEQLTEAVKEFARKLAGRIDGSYRGETRRAAPTAGLTPWEELDISQRDYKEMLKNGGTAEGYRDHLDSGHDNVKEYIVCLKNDISFDLFKEIKKQSIDLDYFIEIDAKDMEDYKIKDLKYRIAAREKSAKGRRTGKIVCWIGSGLGTSIAIGAFIAANGEYKDASAKYEEYQNAVTEADAEQLHTETQTALDEGDDLRRGGYGCIGGAVAFAIGAWLFRSSEINNQKEADELKAELKVHVGFGRTADNGMKISFLQYKW